MRSLFDFITRVSIRFRWITIAITIALMALGIYAVSLLNIELLPSIDFPSTYILARSNGATSGDLMLQAYTIPIENGAADIEGVVNRESNTTTSLVFIDVRNEYGLEQDQIRADLQAMIDELPLPVRTIRPPDGTSAGAMIEELSPEVVLYLYAASLEAGNGFLPQLSPDVWRHFSPEVLGALPEDIFDEIDQQLADELHQKSTGTPQALPNVDTTTPPDLPARWQMDRFETAADLLELTGVRSLATIFNNFVSDGIITGPLGTVSDLTPADITAIFQYEERCRANATPAPQEDDTCSMFRYLDGQAVTALLTQYSAGIDGVLTDDVRLPEEYLAQLDEEDRNQVATVLTAQLLTGDQAQRQVPLPDEWRLESPQLITFGINDIPLGIISVSADEAQMSGEQLRHLVENEVVPQLEALDLVAEVIIEGGEEIRPDLLNAALEAEELQAIAAEPEAEAPIVSSEDTTSEAETNEPSPNDAVSEPVEEGPPLPAIWATFAGTIPGLDELDTADDLLRVPGVAPSQFFNQAVVMAADNAAVGLVINRALAELSSDVLYYLAEHEENFFANISYEVLQVLSTETLSELPEDVQTRAATAPAPMLGEFWQRLSAEPELSDRPLATASDLAAFGDGAANTLNQIALNAPPGLEFYAIRLINDLPAAAVSYLIEQDSAFPEQLDPQVYCYFSADVLNIPDMRDYWSGQDWACRDNEVQLADIAEGNAQTAAQTLVDNNETESRIHDPEAPALPASWPGIAGFVGADELDTADDLFYTTRDGQVQSPSSLLNGFVGEQGAESYIGVLTADVLLYVANCEQSELCEERFFDNLTDPLLLMLSDETGAGLPDDVQARREAARLGTYTPEEMVTRTNGNNSLVLQIRKEGDANTVVAWSDVDEVLEELENENPGVHFTTAFEQASYIEESISGVAREGGLGAVMAVVVILIFLNFSVRSTLVTAVSIPSSVALAFVLMKWVPGNIHDMLSPLSEDTSGVAKDFLAFVLRLFPEDISLNIMTLSGLTVAIGRVVDDAIVVLENIYRNIQKGDDQLHAVLQGTRDVSLAIFAATVTTVVVFLPIGLFGGVIGAFFLPFGLAVTYALMSSFVVAITVVPLLAYLFISKSSLPKEHHSRLEQGYRQAMRWALQHRWAVMLIATVAFILGMLLLGQLPTAFLPSFGEPTITVEVDLPGELNGETTTIAMTDAKVRRLEAYLEELEGIETVQTSVGGGGQAGLFSSDSVSENVAIVTAYVEDQETLDRLTPLVREEASRIFNDTDLDGNPEEEQNNVTVSGASLSEQGFGGFAVVVSGDPDNPPTLADLQQYDALIVETLEEIEGIANVESSLAQLTGSGGDISQTYIRIDGIPAARYTAELETEDTIGLTQQAIDTVSELELPDNIEVTQGFESQQQTEGFQQTFVSMAIAVLIVYGVMVLTFKSFIHPVTILFSLPLAVVGAAVGLAATGRVLGLSSVVGLLMLVGIVVTNAIVLIDRVQTNRKQHQMDTQEALVDGGATRLRPILMTAIATMVALLPLAIGLSSGAIIAAELGTVVIGGLFSSTLLTLIVVPVVYSVFDQVQAAIRKRIAG